MNFAKQLTGPDFADEHRVQNMIKPAQAGTTSHQANPTFGVANVDGVNKIFPSGTLFQTPKSGVPGRRVVPQEE